VATNSNAAIKLREAFIALAMTYKGGKPQIDKSRIKFSANCIYAEYNAVKQRAPSKTHAEITGKLTIAKGRLERIRDDRTDLENTLINAALIFKTMTNVLNLMK
jgi:hypothetical protein